MTATSVKGVGNVMNLGAVPAAPKTGDESFQAVWNSQAGKGTQALEQADGRAQKQAEKTRDSSRKDVSADSQNGNRTEKGSVSEKRDAGKADVKKQSDMGSEKTKPDNGLSQEEQEEVMAVIATAAVDLVRQIADTFGIPAEDVEGLMTQMDLQPADLLKAENLSSLLLEVGGAPDSLALLTDEQLYADFQTVMEQGRQILKDSADSLEMTPEQFLQTAQNTLEQADREPVIEVSVLGEEEPEEETQRPIVKDAAAQTENPAEAILDPAANARETSGEKGFSRRQDKSDPHGQGTGNPFLTEIRNEQFRPQAEEVAETASVWDADTQNIMRQVMDYMRIQIRPNISSLEMQLHPASLGTLQVQVASKGGVLTANFVTQNEAVKAALESQMIQLKESFEQQGVKVEAIEVTVQTHQFEQNLEQGQNRQPQGSGDRKGRSRRVSLDGIADDADEILEEQQAAERMAASGSTVDYTA